MQIYETEPKRSGKYWSFAKFDGVDEGSGQLATSPDDKSKNHLTDSEEKAKLAA